MTLPEKVILRNRSRNLTKFPFYPDFRRMVTGVTGSGT